MQIGLAVVGGTNGRRQLGGGVALEHVPGRAGAQGLHDVWLTVVDGQDHDFGVGQITPDLANGFDPVQARHRQVDHGDIGPQLIGQQDRHLAVLGLGDHFDVTHRFETQADTLANDRVIVGEQNADHLSPSGILTWISVPRGDTGAAWNSPPSSLARSRMPNMPRCSPASSAGTAAMPTPSSRTSSETAPTVLRKRTWTLVARAWRMMLVKASCAMRKRAVSTSAGKRGSPSSQPTTVNCAARPERSSVERTYWRRAATRPRSSSTEGRSSSASLRTSSSVCAARSRRLEINCLGWTGKSAAYVSAMLARPRSRPMMTSVSAWPASSCNSRATR